MQRWDCVGHDLHPSWTAAIGGLCYFKARPTMYKYVSDIRRNIHISASSWALTLMHLEKAWCKSTPWTLKWFPAFLQTSFALVKVFSKAMTTISGWNRATCLYIWVYNWIPYSKWQIRASLRTFEWLLEGQLRCDDVHNPRQNESVVFLLVPEPFTRHLM